MRSVLSLLFIIFLTSCIFPQTVKGEASNDLDTRYPILLVHGFGHRDDINLFPYWGRIPDQLRKNGAKVFLSGQDAFQTYKTNAEIIYRKIQSILIETGAEKVNIIALSKGGIESRYLITVLDKGNRVASLTTIATPHRGTSFADYMLTNTIQYNLPTADIIDFYARILGDKKPDTLTSTLELTRVAMSNFNTVITDIPGVYYQSYGAVMKNPLHEPFYYFSYFIVLSNEGPNDGLISEYSCQWGDFKGILRGSSNSDGLSHSDMQDLEAKTVSGFDAPKFYEGIVRDLKTRGF